MPTIAPETLYRRLQQHLDRMAGLLVDAVRFRDYPVIQGVALVAVAAVVLANLLAEVSIALLDPRMRRA